MSQAISRAIGLLDALAANPADEEAAAVLSDWCEECGFEEAARGLRRPHPQLAHVRALSCLRGLFEPRSPFHGTSHRYDHVQPFPSQAVRAFDRVELDLSAHVSFSLRRVVMADSLTASCSLCELRVGRRLVLGSSSGDQIPGELFGSASPDLFDEPVTQGAPVIVVLQNESRDELYIRMAVLGMLRRPAGAG